MGLLDGKVAVITGAGSGMAKASTKLFVAEGAKVVAADISGAEKDTAAEVGEGVLPVHCDVTQEDDVAAMFEAAVAEFGRVDAVLNVAGMGMAAPIHKFADGGLRQGLGRRPARGLSRDEVRHSSDARSGWWFDRELVVGRRVARVGEAMPTSVYNAAKAAVISVTKSASAEYGRKGIRANAICPGFIETEIMGARAVPVSRRCTRRLRSVEAGVPRK